MNVCRAASDHQRFCAGSAVVREMTTAAISRSAQSPRQPKAQRIATVGEPGRAASAKTGAAPEEAVAGEVHERGERHEPEAGVAERGAPVRKRSGSHEARERSTPATWSASVASGVPRRAGATPEEQRDDPVAESVDPRQQESVERGEVEGLRQATGSAVSTWPASQTPCAALTAIASGEEDGPPPHESEDRIAAVVLALAHPRDQPEDERGRRARRRPSRETPTRSERSAADRIEPERLTEVAQDHARAIIQNAGARGRASGASPPMPRIRGSAWYAIPMRNSAANPRICVWPWICRCEIGTSAPAAIRSRLIMPVVAPSVSVRKSEPRMKCGEKGGDALVAGAAAAAPRSRDGGRADVAEELLERHAVHGREPGERLVRPVVAAAVAEAVLLEDGDRRGKPPPRRRARTSSAGRGCAPPPRGARTRGPETTSSSGTRRRPRRPARAGARRRSRCRRRARRGGGRCGYSRACSRTGVGIRGGRNSGRRLRLVASCRRSDLRRGARHGQDDQAEEMNSPRRR